MTEVSEHPDDCVICKYWIAHLYYDLDRAGARMLDEKKITTEVTTRRAHGVMSEAHYHPAHKTCNERCIR